MLSMTVITVFLDTNSDSLYKSFHLSIPLSPVEKPLNTFGPLNDFKLVFYRGNKSWEEKSPAKGRRGKRIRSEEKSPVRPLKKHNTENCSPTAADNTPTSVAASTPGICQKKLM